MRLLYSKKLQNFTATALIAVVFVSIMGTMYFMGMGMGSDGRMSDCIFMNMGAGICNMTLSEHLNLWQQMFAATPQKSFFLGVLLIILFGIISTAAYFAQYLRPLFFKDFVFEFYLKRKYYLSFFNFLKEAFSQGILNPKIYNLSAV